MMDLETTVYVSVGVLATVCLALAVLLVFLYLQLLSLKRTIQEVQTTSRLRVQKLKLDPESDKNHAFHNPTISPDEELSKRGYSMYMGGDVDVESGRGTERQTGRQLLDDLNREIDQRHHRHSTAPPFLLQGIEENKRRSRSLINTTSSNERASETNPNFIY